MRTFSDYTNVFFWNFKREDNTNYNFEILITLCKAKAVNKYPLHFIKPIIVLVVSIIECILYDFARRVTEHSNELIPNLDQNVVNSTRSKPLDDLEALIAYVKKNNLLRVSEGDSLYDDLDYLRKIRNRIHIQNRYGQLNKDEVNVWTDSNLHLACRALERVCEVLSHVYPRPSRDFVSMTDFPKPWS